MNVLSIQTIGSGKSVVYSSRCGGAPGNDVDETLSSWKIQNGGLALKQKRVSFCDFWHIKDDFAILNATDIIFKAKKAPSY
jgi:hypothetical protein